MANSMFKFQNFHVTPKDDSLDPLVLWPEP